MSVVLRGHERLMKGMSDERAGVGSIFDAT